MGDWKSDAPGVQRKITVADLPAPSSNVLAINPPRVARRPADAQLHVPPGLRSKLYASDFRDPRFLLTAPNGDIFVVESRANQIKVLRDTNGDSKPDITETFSERGLNKPFGIVFYPPGGDPQFLYVANTDGVMSISLPQRRPQRARGPAEQLGARSSSVARRICAVADIGLGTSSFSPDGKKSVYVSIGSRSNDSDSASEAERRAFSSSTLIGTDQKVYAWGISQRHRNRISSGKQRALDEH